LLDLPEVTDEDRKKREEEKKKQEKLEQEAMRNAGNNKIEKKR